ncbi:ABC transporter ATP-binding protein/permease [Paenibacillus sp. N4]|uniref:ABC transporter ATP-binding protein n=1 Tax=Paenibacillus vietnamensis TaxID=2590547 RepID=UPI001CD0FFF0|nr:ABC transporter ATP-binding protein [Paenibacillus vietnamensis]MCA0756834.1 ABC transporter ATP-binding protein/permease [Paenibacillus vietnamensis]
MSTFTYMWRLIRYRPGWYMTNAIVWTVIYLMPIFPGLITKAFFDSLTMDSAVEVGTWGLVALLLGAALARSGVVLIGFITDVNFRFRMGMLLRRNVLEHILKEPGAKAIPCSPGEAISHFRDDVDQSEEAVSWSVDVFGMTCFAAVSCFILIRIDAQMTLLVFLPLVIVVVAAQLATTRLQKYREDSRESTAKVTGAISEMFGSVQAIQVAGAEKRVIARFRELNDNRRKTMLKDKLMTEALDSIFSNSVNLGTGLILLLAGHKMRGGEFTVGDFSLFVYYLTFVTQFISNFGKFLTYFKQMAVALMRLTGILQGAPAKVLTEANALHLSEDKAEAQEPELGEAERLERLTVKGLTYHYPETGRGIESIDLELRRGTFTVVTGPIGSGKTTLVRALLGLLPQDGGEVRWNGRLVGDPGSFFVPPRSAYTAQVPRLYSDTLRENILLGHPDKEGRLDRALHTAVLDEDIAHFQQGLDTVIGPRGVKLSGGQAQRTAAARMLVRDSELYVFDDLSSALDVETEQKLWARLFRERGDATCLVVSHRKAALAQADRIVLMKDGKIEAEGTAEALLAGSEAFRRLWHGEEG